MTIDLQRSGRWRVRVTTDQGKRPTIGTFDTEEEATRAEAAALDVLRGKHRTTLGSVLVDSLEHRAANKATRNPEDEESRFRVHLAGDPLMTTPIADVQRRDVVDLIARLKGTKRAHQTVLNILTVLRNGLNFAVEKEMIPASPFANIRLPAPARTADAWHYASPREQRHLLETTPLKYRPMVAFAIGTGLRAGELVTLRLADVQLDAPDPFVTVRYGSPPDGLTKNGKIRRVPLLPLARQATLAQLDRLAGEEGDEGAPRRANPHGLLFPTEREGTFRDPDHVLPWGVWSKIRAPLGNRLRWHDLRHTCASSLVSGWWGRRWSLEEVCALLGHSDIRVTQRYAHLAESALMRAASETLGGAAANNGGRNGGDGGGGGEGQGSVIVRPSLPTGSLTTAVHETAPFGGIVNATGRTGPGEVRAGLGPAPGAGVDAGGSRRTPGHRNGSAVAGAA